MRACLKTPAFFSRCVNCRTAGLVLTVLLCKVYLRFRENGDKIPRLKDKNRCRSSSPFSLLENIAPRSFIIRGGITPRYPHYKECPQRKCVALVCPMSRPRLVNNAFFIAAARSICHSPIHSVSPAEVQRCKP